MRARLRRFFSFATFTPPFYWACTYLLRGVLWVVVRWEVTGRERVPMEGGLIVASNHLNNADPPIVGAGFARRRIRWMAKVELFKMPFGLIIKLWGAFPVRRFDADLAAMLNAERILKNGGVLGMFPEGTRSRTGYMGPPHPGTAVIALRSGATILPCAMTGTEKLKNPLIVFRRPKFTFDIGEPIVVEKVKRPTEAQVSELTNRIVEAIAAMLPESYRPPYTGSEGVTEAEATAPEEPNGRDNPGE
ncbi:MAG TPA: lysophospholipid acyltransferase family protein [Tepidiformaceae bacterium]|nr:lysophospholipid acyltransferase family protein [Tepidiformaceae bacterium]HMO94847.1 lysophospholipid acyltransferase family protein [Tepidiformaceae bacterium]